MSEEQEKKNIFQIISGWPPARKLSLAGAALLSIGLFALLIIQARVADNSLLFANLSDTDAATVLERLKEKNISFELKDGGRDIYVPADKVYEIRLELAGAGIPQGGGVGFEIFDRQSFGVTDFTQKINLRRALQGELARTIASLSPVEAARVHLAIPEKRLFQEDRQEASASVIVRLRSGYRLDPSQIQGILNLVSGSVEGLAADQVAVIDSNGTQLSSRGRGEGEPPLDPGMLDYQQRMEKRLEERAQSLLDRALGAGNSMVRVTAALDFSKREVMEESYDPERTVIRSERTSEQKGGKEALGGVPGTNANSQGAAATVIPTSQTEETVNYEVSKTISKIVDPVGVLKTLSVAVLVADRRIPGEEGAEPGFEARTAQELDELQAMVANALGVTESRGDRIEVVSMPFAEGFETLPASGSTSRDMVREYLPVLKYLLIAIGALLLYFLFVRPMLKTLKGETEVQMHYKTVEQMEAQIAGGESLMLPESVDPAGKLRQQVLKEETSPAKIIKSWLKEN